MGYKSPKVYTIPIAFGTSTMIANSAYYFGGVAKAISNTEGARIITIQRAGTIKSISLFMSTTGNPTAEDLTFIIRKNAGVGCDIDVANFSGASPSLTVTNYNLDLDIAQNDTIEIKVSTANPFVTPPSAAILAGHLLVECA